MTQEGKLEQKLDNWRFSDGRETLDHAGPNWQLRLTAECADQVGCKLWEVSLTQTPLTSEALKLRGDRLAGRVTGLLEALRLIELDAERKTVLLRSTSPARSEEGVRYYEMLLHGDGQTLLHRYQGATAEEPRHQIGFTLTHEALVKLVGDLTL